AQLADQRDVALEEASLERVVLLLLNRPGDREIDDRPALDPLRHGQGEPRHDEDHRQSSDEQKTAPPASRHLVPPPGSRSARPRKRLYARGPRGFDDTSRTAGFAVFWRG